MEKRELNLAEEMNKLEADELKANQEISNVEGKIKFYRNFAWILLGLGFIIGIIGFLAHHFGWDWNLNLLGDYVGGVVGSTWSLAGLFIIYVAFLGQRIQLIQQKLELRYNQFEVRATRNELIEQNKTLRQQRFENTFFQMLNLHHQIVNAIDFPHPANVKGRDCFKHIYEKRFEILCRNLKNEEKLDSFGIGRTLLQYEKIFKENQSDFSHYFRNLYTITKFIHQSDNEDKQKYIDILRAQLSTHELLLLFYNGLSDYGNKKFKPLIEKYALLKNMPQQSLIEIEHIKGYNSTAYN